MVKSGTAIGGSLVIGIVAFTLLVRCMTAIHGHSGQGKPPMFGDYEAQRHWMEITLHLAPRDWYRNTSDNDLQYWGLDYPPLTAYHSYLMGHVANKINESFVELFKSRGMETDDHKMFMRATVIVSELITFYSSTWLLMRNKGWLGLLLALLNPSLILIDHGHFQYNSVSLGLMQLAVACLFFKRTGRHSISGLIGASIFFSMALNFKQMELYHALPFFFYLLAICVGNKIECLSYRAFKLGCVGLSVIVTFALLCLPFAFDGIDTVLQVLTRIFPFQRGLFEDKVANFWFSISAVFKLRQLFSVDLLSRVSLLVTALFSLPAGIDLLIRPTRPRFLVALLNSSLIFYLFSFQVHEKSILLATIPACLLISEFPLFVTWFQIIANLSMLPLLYKDGLVSACLSQTLMFFLLAFTMSPNFWPCIDLTKLGNAKTRTLLTLKSLLKLTFGISLVCSMILTICFLFVKPPNHLPDLWTVLICLFSCAHFLAFAVIFHSAQFTLSSLEINDNIDFKCCLNNKHYIVETKKIN